MVHLKKSEASNPESEANEWIAKEFQAWLDERSKTEDNNA
jgi:hypothetical protein